MYARGMSVREIVGHLRDLYGLEAGEVKVPVKYDDKEGEMPAYRAMPDKGS